MPIPSLRVAPPPAPYVPPERQIPTVDLVGGNGDTITLTGATAGYDLLAERGLFGIPDPGAQFKDGVGDGARWTGSRRPARTIDLNVQVRGETGLEFRQRMARLANILDDRYGAATLRAVTKFDVREITVVYTSGWTGDGSGLLYQNIAFTVTAPDPYWRSTTAQRAVWRAAGGKPFLSSTVPFFPVQLSSSSQVFGSASIVNPGDVAGPATWTITGPGGPVTIAPNATAGSGFSIPTTLTPTDVITVDGDAKTVRDSSGANRYDLLASAPKIWPIPPGTSTAVVSIGSVSTGTSVVLSWFPRYKLAA